MVNERAYLVYLERKPFQKKAHVLMYTPLFLKGFSLNLPSNPTVHGFGGGVEKLVYFVHSAFLGMVFSQPTLKSDRSWFCWGCGKAGVLFYISFCLMTIQSRVFVVLA
jgi:hypothetical protein